MYAGGPFSDRNAIPAADGSPSGVLPPNDFATFIELDRVALASANFRVFGSTGFPGGAPNDAVLGPVLGLKAQLAAGLDAAIAMSAKDPESLSQDDGVKLFDAQPDDFKSLVIDLVCEGAFAAPEYGGNLDRAGWAMCHFEGDSLPLGFSQFTPAGYVERAARRSRPRIPIRIPSRSAPTSTA